MKCPPLKELGKYCMIEPPGGASREMLMAGMYSFQKQINKDCGMQPDDAL